MGTKARLSQIDSITSSEYGWYYITSITKSQVEKIVRRVVIQQLLFSDELIGRIR